MKKAEKIHSDTEKLNSATATNEYNGGMHKKPALYDADHC